MASNSISLPALSAISLMRLADAKIGDGGAGALLVRGIGLAPALFVAGVDQPPQLAIETVQRGGAADHRRGRPHVAIQCRGAFEERAAEPQAASAWRKPFGVDIKDQEKGAMVHVGGQEIVRFPRVDRNDGSLAERVVPLVDVDPARRAVDVKNQMPFAMRMHVERTIELIDRRAAKMAVKHGKSPAHPFLPRIVTCCFW